MSGGLGIMRGMTISLVEIDAGDLYIHLNDDTFMVVISPCWLHGEPALAVCTEGSVLGGVTLQ